MSFISYAQNFEDVMLWRALKHIEQGFYIDVGAWSPDTDSVTRAFYKNNWCGINIEPNPEFHEQLEASRPRDVNLNVAVGDTEGSMTMNFLNNTGLSTLNDAIALQHQAAGLEASRREVEIKTLATIWQQHVRDGQPVHFLKVDVEGFEEAVLRGNDWARYRPWVVVVEATLPMSQIESHGDWEPIFLEAEYKFAYADGLNRFYVAKEHADLLSAFKYPPNVFDEFILATKYSELEQLHAHSQWLQNEWDAAKAKIDELNHSSHHWWAMADELNRELQSVYRSKSWRITWPLRKLMQLLGWLFQCPFQVVVGLVRLPKRAARWVLAKVIAFVLRREGLKHRVRRWLYRHPKLEAHLRAFARARGFIHGRMPAPSHPVETKVSAGARQEVNDLPGDAHLSESLTPRARQIYADLKAAIEKNKQEAA